MRCVLDTNVVVSAILWRGTPGRLMDAAREGTAELATSTPLLRELSRILERPRFGARLAATGRTINAIVSEYAALATLVRPDDSIHIAIDPDDDIVVGTATAAKADLIASGDFDLLRLREYAGIRIVTAANAVAALR
jgi:putative PIN family toxin of toxin-antitoxin system